MCANLITKQEHLLADSNVYGYQEVGGGSPALLVSGIGYIVSMVQS